ncbi:MAG: hypothetical protein ACI86S_000264 [Paracoccaceae bacterium]|jgi:hypothetical protein
MTARRMISGLQWKHLKGSVFVMSEGYETALPASSKFVLTQPFTTLGNPRAVPPG